MYEDIKKIYAYLKFEQQELQKFYNVLKSYRSIVDGALSEYEAILEDFLHFVGLEKTKETLLAAINRIVNLREDMLLQVIADKDEEERIAIKERAFVWVSEFYLARFARMLEWIEKERLLSPFYRALLRHVHTIGEAFSSWQSSWMAQIIYGINRDLLELFEGDEEKIFAMLQEKALLDKGHGDEVADRCYSVLRMREDGSFERLSYAKAFKEEVQEVARRIEEAITDLARFEEAHKEGWLAYLERIKTALLEEDVDRLVPRWADVDRAWMQIRTPIQIGHPLEYYEDRFRKAVALEWDVRITDPDYPVGDRAKKITLAFEKLYADIGIEAPSVYRQTLESLQRVQLYVGRPLLFYGSEFNGLFSAQVVPNDEVVSREFGKKIFAYPDMILQTQRAKPKMRITYEVFGTSLADRMRALLEDEATWHAIYDATTIGHEYGHILWMDEESETVMNASGLFKLAEEFKATTGGLVAYFLFENDRHWQELLLDHIQRSVALVGWMEVDEVLPYYTEGLLHLVGLFATGVLTFDGSLQVRSSEAAYARLKSWYMQTYTELARTYLLKRDSKEFLDRFIHKEGKNWMPKDPQTAAFVRYYYDLYKAIGREVVE